MSDFPTDVRPAMKAFHLDGKSTIYAVCPKPTCHRTYKPIFEHDSPIPTYPIYCSHREYRDGKRCKERLLRPHIIKGIEIHVPIKKYVSFDFKDWVGSLLSRPGFEAQMDSAWDVTSRPQSPTDNMRDIFDGELLRNFKGPDRKHFRLGGDEGRYAFSLSADFFNPLTNKQAGKKKSVGIISVVCLNIPPGLRYKPENMFLAGVVPGPKEPPLTTFNHYLTPLVDAFLEFWKPGVRFTRTFNFPLGRLVLCALVVVVCDLLAARKVSGFAAVSHTHFCSICHCTRKKEGYGDVNYDEWEWRTHDECRESADQFRNATNPKERQAIFDRSGLRWSELLRLPYFDPVRFIVVDAMHNLFLGLVKEHLEGILGVCLEKEDDERVLEIKLSNAWKDFLPRDQKGVERLKKWLEARLDRDEESHWPKKLERNNLHAIEFVCNELKCPLLPRKYPNSRLKKKDWIEALIAWVSKFIENGMMKELING